MTRYLILLLAISLVGCKSYEFKAQNKSELAKVCLAEFPPNYEPTDRISDTTYLDRIEYIEVDCDTIGKKEVPHVCKEKIVKETIYTTDPRQAYLIQNLEGKLELKQERISQLISLHSEAIGSKDNQHKEEIKTLKSKHSNELKATRKGRNNWRLIAIIGAVVVVVIKRFRII